MSRLKVVVDTTHWNQGSLHRKNAAGEDCYCVQGFILHALGVPEERLGDWNMTLHHHGLLEAASAAEKAHAFFRSMTLEQLSDYERLATLNDGGLPLPYMRNGLINVAKRLGIELVFSGPEGPIDYDLLPENT